MAEQARLELDWLAWARKADPRPSETAPYTGWVAAMDLTSPPAWWWRLAIPAFSRRRVRGIKSPICLYLRRRTLPA